MVSPELLRRADDQDWELIISVHGDDRCAAGVREVVDLFDETRCATGSG